MGLFLGSVAFHCPVGGNQETLIAWLEQLFRKYDLDLMQEIQRGKNWGVYDTEMACEGSILDLACDVSRLTGDYAVGALCVDSDFVELGLFLDGVELDHSYMGRVYEEFCEVMGTEVAPKPDLDQWRKLLLRPEDAEALEACLYGEYVLVEDGLRTLSELTGFPILNDDLMTLFAEAEGAF